MTQLDLNSHAKVPVAEAPESEALDSAVLDTEPSELTKLGRRRDHSRDADILQAALDVLAETGYDGMTIDMVAARAKAGKATLYRRWPSKGHLVVDAVACMKSTDAEAGAVPDTGTLRGDLLAMIKPHTVEQGERKLRIMAGISSMMSREPELAGIAKRQILEPQMTITRTLLQRAKDRGEISPDIDIEQISCISPAMAGHRALVLGKPVTPEFVLSLIDNVILPACRLSNVR
ncbi:MAG: AcrR family transcriptional regulator [Subtercola sp.]|nr:AcrR family transcriptional regulator [Subtercola sp.]